MALIKSALELALEKTKDLKVDPVAAEAASVRQEGKRLAGQYLDEPAAVDLGKKIEATAKDKRRWLKEGMIEIFSARLQLPSNETQIEAIAAIGQGYAALAQGQGLLGGAAGAIAEKKVQALFQQLSGFMRQYLDDMKNVEQVIRKQWAPKLREKERAMASRLGQEVRLDPMMDPEFAAFYKQNVGQVRQQYQDALDRAKADLEAVLGLAREE